MLKIRKKTFAFDDLLLVPRFSRIQSRSSVDLTTRLGPLDLTMPMISANMDTVTEANMARAMEALGGFGIIHRYLKPEERLEQVRLISDLRFRAISVGVTASEIEFGKDLIRAGANILCLDIAHGHCEMMETALKTLRAFALTVPVEKFAPLKQLVLIAGNVATPEATADLDLWGADIIKVGIGPGSMCTTRVVTGAGYGQLSAISDCREATKKGLIADGGIRTSGDATKAFAAGADAIMAGRLLAGTDEVPEWALEKGSFRGMASSDAQGKFYGYAFTDRHPEGVSVKISRQGPVSAVIGPFLGGLRSGLSYVGVTNLKDLREFAEFVECGNSVLLESLPHGSLTK